VFHLRSTECDAISSAAVHTHEINASARLETATPRGPPFRSAAGAATRTGNGRRRLRSQGGGRLHARCLQDCHHPA
jgi:hypothetical protein